ncbi:FUSC family protein [Streptomyces sp. NPDC051920]|uniref:FUSC family protein n=1 Tax=Streptomyces sp. NPDC051920 TaxID=3155523 RepID=UPI003415A3CE
MNVLRSLLRRDAGLTALRRSVRAAIVAPGLFAVALALTDSPVVPLFAAFGSIAMLLFVEFAGPMRDRLIEQAALVVTGAVLISLGTLVSREVWLCTLATAVVSFLVLFSGVVSSALAGASTSLLVSFVLAATLPGTAQAIPDRLAGWGLAGVTSLLAVRLLWPTPVRDPLRDATATACRALAVQLRAEADCVLRGFGTADRTALGTVVNEANDAVTALRDAYFATPYRPTGLATSTRVLIRLVDEVLLLATVLDRVSVGEKATPSDAVVCGVKTAAADLLRASAEALSATDDQEPGHLTALQERLAMARSAMENTVTSFRPVTTDGREAGRPRADIRPDTTATRFLSSLEPSFRAQEMSFAVSVIARNVELILAARGRTLWQRLIGQRPEGAASTLASAQERAGAHTERHSAWLRNSVRGAIALALAVLVAEQSGVQHSFWVVFGTLAVLRSSAVLTGQNSLRAIAGTAVGILIGGGLIYLIGSNTPFLWALLPIAVLFTGLAPATISFAAGQAGFTVSILILFNLLEPVGWTVGIVRIEDVAIGCAVSVVVGMLFWPRGAAPLLGHALAEGFSESTRYLRGAIGYGVTRCDSLVRTAPLPDEERYRAAAAARRLDDAFRGFLAERGTKHLPLTDVTTLVTAVAVLRLTADAVLDLWGRDEGGSGADRSAARSEIDRSRDALVSWYEATADAMAGLGDVPEAQPRDVGADERLIRAVERDLVDEKSEQSPDAIRVVWTADHLEAARRLQRIVLKPARAVAERQREHNARLRLFRFSGRTQGNGTR